MFLLYLYIFIICCVIGITQVKGNLVMSTDRYDEFRAKAINSKQMFDDLVNKTESGFKMYKVQALGDESYLSRFLVEKDCFDLPEDKIRSRIEEMYGVFCFKATVLKEDETIDYLGFRKDNVRIRELFSGDAGIVGCLGTRHLSFLNLEDAMEYLNWEKNDPTRIQARKDKKEELVKIFGF